MYMLCIITELLGENWLMMILLKKNFSVSTGILILMTLITDTYFFGLNIQNSDMKYPTK